MTARVVVVGSANVDVVLTADRRPLAGETVMGRTFIETPGGKGANQALASSRFAPTSFVGCMGRDADGESVEAALVAGGVNIDHVFRCDVPTGHAYITVTPDGENSIVVMALANSELSVGTVLEALKELRPTVVLIQLEVPRAVTDAVLVWCRDRNIRLVFNPSPVDSHVTEMADHADPLIVNQHEARSILGLESGTESDLAAALAKKCRSVVVTAGAQGAFVGVGSLVTAVVGSAVEVVVDTTGAGDAFAGSLAAHLANGLDVVAAATLANAEAARVVQMDRTKR